MQSSSINVLTPSIHLTLLVPSNMTKAHPPKGPALTNSKEPMTFHRPGS